MVLNKKKLGVLILALIMMLSLIPNLSFASNPDTKDIIIEDVMVTMRDGKQLATKVYRPKKDGKYPVLLTRTPYNSGAFQENEDGSQKLGDYSDVGKKFAKDGYVVAVQDLRGVFKSEGRYTLSLDDAKDGHDTVEWLAEQPWSNGKVGTFGSSARGITQTLLAPEQPEGLEAMFIIVAPSQIFEGSLFQGGAYRLEFIQNWLAGMNVTNAQKLLEEGEITQKNFEDVVKYAEEFPENYWKMPLKDLYPMNLLGAYNDLFEHYVKDGYYDYRDVQLNYSNINVPAYHVGGWYDVFAEGPINNFVGLQTKGGKGARGNQKLLMGPWSHRDVGDSKNFTGDEVDINAEMKKWFDYWLKGIDNGIMKEAPIRYYTMGDNEWKTANKWPVQTSKSEKWYLNDGESGSADSLNDAVLSKKVPRAKTAHTFEYDPADPNITIGGPNLYGFYGVGPMDQRTSEKNSLTYTSEVLKEDVEITGNITATLYVSSDAKDTDFTVKLTDVSPDGTSTLLNDGIQRMRFREGLDKEVFMEDGEVYKIEVILNDTSHVFKEGHRIRVAISSSNFPRFDRNPNTGNPFGVDTEKDFIIANNTVHLSSKYSSHISLPVVKNRK